MLFESLMRVLNGGITLTCFMLLFNIYRSKEKPFFLYWSLGFLLTGVVTLLNGVLPPTIVITYYPALFFLSTSGYYFIIVGLGELVNRTIVMLSGTLIIPAILWIYNIVNGNWRDLIWFIEISPYLFISLSLFFIMLVHNYYNLRVLLVGWASILVLNLFNINGILPVGPFEILSAISTGIIYLGMTRPSFVFIVEDLSQFIQQTQSANTEMEQGKFTIIRQTSPSKTEAVNWIKNRIDANTRIGVRTIIASYYDLLTPAELTINDNELVFFIRVQMGANNPFDPSDSNITTINDDINQLGLLLTDLMRTGTENQAPFEFILYPLSTIIHTQGWKRIYSFLIAMIPLIKSSNVNMIAFLYPESHDDPSEVSKFEVLADTLTLL